MSPRDAWDTVTAALDRAGCRRARGWCCPAHYDHNPSLSVSFKNGRVLLRCHAGCSTEDILRALRLEWSDLFDEEPESKPQISSTYPYVDEQGAVLFEVVRYFPKAFKQRRPDGNGGYTWGLDGTRRVLYRLPKVLEAAARGKDVFIVEGEKDVHALEGLGVVATCNAGGAGKWREQYNEALAGARIWIVADDDNPGRIHAAQVQASLASQGMDADLVLPAQGTKDAADHVAAGNGLADWRAFEPEVEADSREFRAVRLDWRALLKDGVPPVDYLDPPYFVRAARTWAWGPSGTAKSIFAMWKAAALSRSGHQVVYISEENPLVEDIRRLGRLNPADTLDVYHRQGFDFTQPEWIEELLRVSEGAAMVVLDSWSDCWSGDENDNRAFSNSTRPFSSPSKPLEWPRC